jgi:transposase
MVDEGRRRVRQETLGRRGRKGDPLCGIPQPLQIGAKHLSEKQAARLEAKLLAGEHGHEVTLPWQCYQKLRNIYHSRPEKGRHLLTEVITSFPPARSRKSRVSARHPHNGRRPS